MSDDCIGTIEIGFAGSGGDDEGLGQYDDLVLRFHNPTDGVARQPDPGSTIYLFRDEFEQYDSSVNIDVSDGFLVEIRVPTVSSHTDVADLEQGEQ